MSVRVKVLTTNVSGTKINAGNPTPVVGVIRDAVDTHAPHVIGIQEVCEVQAKAVLANLGSAWRMVFYPCTRSSICGPNDLYGNAQFVLSTTTPNDVDIVSLPNPADRQGRKICGMYAYVQGLWCYLVTTHLDYSVEGNQAQLDALVKYLRGRVASSRRLVFTGDVNFHYAEAKETALRAVVPVEVYPTDPDGKSSVDRIKASAATAGGRELASMGARLRFDDPRTDHQLYVANLYLPSNAEVDA